MNAKTKRWLRSILFTAGSAYALYDKLAQGASPDQLVVQTPPADVQPEQQEAPLPGEVEGLNQQEDTEPEKILVPDFTVYDLDGNKVRLSDFFGKPIVLNFWASWCGP